MPNSWIPLNFVHVHEPHHLSHTTKSKINVLNSPKSTILMEALETTRVHISINGQYSETTNKVRPCWHLIALPRLQISKYRPSETTSEHTWMLIYADTLHYYIPFRNKGCPVDLFSDRYAASLTSPSSTTPVFAIPSSRFTWKKKYGDIINYTWNLYPLELHIQVKVHDILI